ncbi:MAG: hypothetical protein RL156_1707 [Bacteroidota bacterium]|jgi:hypothetical protein
MPRDIYTADMGNPPSPDEGAPVKKKPAKKPMVRRPMPDVYTADMGTPPSPDEGPTAPVRSSTPRQSRPFAKGGKVGSASKRADGIAQRGKTKGKII